MQNAHGHGLFGSLGWEKRCIQLRIPGLHMSHRCLSLLEGTNLVRLYPLGFETLHIHKDQQSSIRLYCATLNLRREYSHVRNTMYLVTFLYKESHMNCLDNFYVQLVWSWNTHACYADSVMIVGYRVYITGPMYERNHAVYRVILIYFYIYWFDIPKKLIYFNICSNSIFSDCLIWKEET
jgi:hypothetical protein